MSVLAIIPLDVKAANASINKGRPILMENSKSIISKEIVTLADRLITKHTGVVPISAAPQKKRFSLFRKG